MPTLLMCLALFVANFFLTACILWMAGRLAKAPGQRFGVPWSSSSLCFAQSCCCRSRVRGDGTAASEPAAYERHDPTYIGGVRLPPIELAVVLLLIRWLMRTTFLRAGLVFGIGFVPALSLCQHVPTDAHLLAQRLRNGFQQHGANSRRLARRGNMSTLRAGYVFFSSAHGCEIPRRSRSTGRCGHL